MSVHLILQSEGRDWIALGWNLKLSVAVAEVKSEDGELDSFLTASNGAEFKLLLVAIFPSSRLLYVT